MSYHIYITEAIILNKKDIGEADRGYSFFTKDFGRVEAVAQGIRYLKSKLRYSLSGLSFLKIAFVETSNEYWRLIDAKEIEILDGTRGDYYKTKSAFGIFSLLSRLIQGQESDKELWEKLKNILIFLERNKLSQNNLKNFEILTALQILAHLGYMEENKKWESLSLEEIGKEKDHLVSIIQRSLEQSML